MAQRDYYEVLGAGRNANEEQIRAAYRKLARKYHPDVNKAPDAAQKFKEATAAYEVLSDPQTRRMYDQVGHEGARGSPGRGGAGTYTWTGRPGEGVPVDFEEIFGASGSGFMGMGLDEILDSLRGKAGRRGPQRAPHVEREDLDLEVHLNLDFLQAIWGGPTRLQLRRQTRTGERTETIDVKIPPGVNEGSRIRLRGKGSEGPGGAGDLYIITHVREHPYFRREGDDIYVEVPIGIAEAALGAKVDVPTIDGMTTVTVPPGTSSSRKLRLRGKGVAGRGGGPRGDQYVLIKIVPPPTVTPEGQELLRKLQALDKFDPRADLPWKQNR